MWKMSRKKNIAESLPYNHFSPVINRFVWLAKNQCKYLCGRLISLGVYGVCTLWWSYCLRSIFSSCVFCIKENDSSHIKLSAIEPFEDLVAYGISSGEDRMAGVAWWLGEELLHLPLRSHSKSVNLLHTFQNINAFANLWQYLFLKLANKIQQMLSQMTPHWWALYMQLISYDCTT